MNKDSVDPNVYDDQKVYDHCIVRVIWNPYDPDNPILDWCKMSHMTPCSYPPESIIEMIEDVQVIVLTCSETGQSTTMWKRYAKPEPQENKTYVDMNIYDREEWLEHQTVDVYYPVSGQGDVILDYYPTGTKHFAVFLGYVKKETYEDVRVQVLTNTVINKTSAAWTRYPADGEEDFE